MKRFLMFTIFAMVFMVASTVQAADREPYVGGSFGYGIVMDIQDDEDPDTEFSLDAGPNFSLIAGFDLGEFRVEGEIGYFAYDFDEATFSGGSLAVDGDVTGLKFMANGYYDIEMPNSSLTPYVGLGLGVVNSDIELIIPGFGTFTDDGTDFAFQLMLGAGFEINKQLTLTAGYRFLGTDEFDDSFLVHDLVLGVRYSL